MNQTIIMPKLGLTMTHGVITKWHKKVGDSVKAGEVIVEIETDKINSEVESPIDGYVIEILANEGDEKEITAPICVVGDSASDSSRQIEGSPAGVAAGGTTGGTAGNAANDAEVDAKGDAANKVTGDAGRIVDAPGAGTVVISPLARKIALENKIDYTKIKGTGPGGRIVKEDILAAISSGKTENKTEKTIPLSGKRKVIAQRMSQSKREIPHAYFRISVDASRIFQIKKQYAQCTLNDIIIKCAAAAIHEFPAINATFENDIITLNDQINIGFAVDVDNGLIVPVVKDAYSKGIEEISAIARELADKARKGNLAYDDITGGTFTISNLGAYYIDEFTAIVNPPECAILAVGRASEAPWAENGSVVIKPVMNLTLSVDHRVIDGALAARFMKKLKDILENPEIGR